MYAMGFVRFLIILLALTGSNVRFGWRPRDEIVPENLESWLMEDQEYPGWIDVPSGDHKPNQTVSVRFENKVPGIIYYRLIRIHGKPEIIFVGTKNVTVEDKDAFNWTIWPPGLLIRIRGEPEIIFEEIRNVTVEDKDAFTWTVQLPEDAPAFYRIGAMFWSGKLEGMDHVTGWVQTIIVPEQKLNAYMFLDKEEYDRNEKMRLTIVNNGTTELHVTHRYLYQKYVDGEWTEVPWDRIWVSIGPAMHPPMTNQTRTLDHPDFTGGRYRVCRHVERGGTDIGKTLKAEFTIKPTPIWLLDSVWGSPIWMIIGAFAIIFGISLILIQKYRI